MMGYAVPNDLALLLFGDSVQDEYILPQRRLGGFGGEQDAQDWQHHDQWVRCTQAGGVDMTAAMFEAYRSLTVYVAKVVGEGERTPNLTSIVEIGPCKVGGKPEMPTAFVSEQVILPSVDGKSDNDAPGALYRVTRFMGYSGRPASGHLFALPDSASNEPAAIVINDAGSVLRHSKDTTDNAFVTALETVRSATDIVTKMHLPLMKGLAWSKVSSATKARSRVVVVHADDLREAGMALSRCPSWNQVMSDLRQAKALNNKILTGLMNGCDLLIVLFDVEGAAIIGRDKPGGIRFVYEPGLFEGQTANSVPGQIVGTMNSFLVQFVLDYTGRSAEADIGEVVERALGAAQMFAASGYTRDGDRLVYPPVARWVSECDDETDKRTWPEYQHTFVPWESQAGADKVDLLQLVLAQSLSPADLQQAYLDKARNIVLKGNEAEVSGLPHGQFGKLLSVDPDEIQSLRAIDTLIRRYIADTWNSKPLSLAVFGPPGSGKSFGVKQLVDEDVTPIREYNLSQAGEGDLPSFFHEIRDLNLKGKMPLCFFDEFDSQDRALLKSFLAPMQDGVFLEGEALRPIGRGIFVFAGGTASTLEAFAKYALNDGGNADSHVQAKMQKLPDFVSRLQAFLNVKGPNAVAKAEGQTFEERCAADPSYVLRRAILLRLFLETNLSGIINHTTKEASIAPKLLDALLEVQDYKHGARSMELFMKAMVRGQSQRKLDRSHLPIDSLVGHFVTPADSFTQKLR